MNDNAGSDVGRSDVAGQASGGVADFARPLLQKLAGASDETAVLCVWDGASAVTTLCEGPRVRDAERAAAGGLGAQGVAFLANLHDDAAVERALTRASEEQRLRLLGLIEDAEQRGYATAGAGLPGVAAIAATR